MGWLKFFFKYLSAGIFTQNSLRVYKGECIKEKGGKTVSSSSTDVNVLLMEIGETELTRKSTVTDNHSVQL